MAIINISGTISSSFQVIGTLANAAQGLSDVIFTIDLRPTNPIINVKDNLNYGVLGWDENDVVAVISIIGPEGAIYRNEDYNSPDIVPATSKYLNKTITLPLDPLTDYENILKGNYTLKVSWYNSNLDEYYSFLKTYQYNFIPPTIANKTVSGPYTGILKSTDITEYGNDVYQIIREHRVQYPDELDPQPADVVSSNEEIQVSPIYTNEWNIIINSFVEYRQSDTLRVYWEGTGEFTHCVYGGCLGSMYDVIVTMLETYTEELACNLVSKEQYQHRLVTLNTAWHLLNEAYWSGDAEGADEQAYIIQEQVAYTGSGICGGSSSEEVIPCPPWTGGGIGGTYTFLNGLTEGAGVVVLGGTLNQNTSILTGGYSFALTGSSGGNSIGLTASAPSGNIVASANDGSYGGEVEVSAGSVELKYTDIGTPANNVTYTVGATGIVEAADYTSLYTDRTLVSKAYVDSIIGGLTAVSTDTTLNGDGTPGDPLSVAVPFPGFTSLLDDYGYTEPTHAFSDLTSHPTTLAGYGITDAPTTFVALTDTPTDYTGSAGYFLRVNTGATAIEFVTGSWVPVSGGTFTGQVTISTSTDRPLVLKQIGAGSIPGTPEGGINYISFQDNDGDEQGYIGISASGDIILHTNVTGGGVFVDNDLEVDGNVAVTGSISVDTISEYTSNAGTTLTHEVYLTGIGGTGTGTSILYYDRVTGEVTYGDLTAGSDGVLSAVNASDITAVDFTITGGTDVLDVDFGHNLQSHDNVVISSLQTNDILKWNGASWVNVPIPSSGTGNAYANITDGTNTSYASGADTFKLRTGNNILTIVVTDNDATHGDNAVFTINESNIDHDNLTNTHNLTTDIDHDQLTNFVVNEHINHSSVSIATSTTSGLTGGGDLTTTRNIALDFTRLTNETVLADADEFAYYDSSATAMRALTYQALKTILNNDLDIGASNVSVTNQGNERIVTSTSVTDELNAEANLTFDGSTLIITGTLRSTTGYIRSSVADSTGAVAFGFDTTVEHTYSSSHLVNVKNYGALKFAIDYQGRIQFDGTSIRNLSKGFFMIPGGSDPYVAIGSYSNNTAFLTIQDQDSSTPRTETLAVYDTNQDSLFQIKHTGQMVLNKYGAGTFTGTSTKWLAVDQYGNVIEKDTPSVGGCSFGSDNQIPYTNATGTDFDYTAGFTYDGSVNVPLSSGKGFKMGTYGSLHYSSTGPYVEFYSAGTLSWRADDTYAMITSKPILVNRAIYGGSYDLQIYHNNSQGYHTTLRAANKQDTGSAGNLYLGAGLGSGGATSGAIYLYTGASGPYSVQRTTETNVLYYDPSNGKISYGVGGGGGCSFGSDNEIPFTNATGTDFDYNDDFYYDVSAHAIVSDCAVGQNSHFIAMYNGSSKLRLTATVGAGQVSGETLILRDWTNLDATIYMGTYNPGGTYFTVCDQDTVTPATSVFRVYHADHTLLFNVKSTGDIDMPNGDLIVSGIVTATNFQLSSDKRLKEGIHDLNVGINQYMALDPKGFYFIKDPSKLNYGFIAQDIEAIFPNMVSRDNEGYLKFSITHIVPLNTMMIKRHETRIERLEAENDILKQRIKQLESKV